MTYIYVLKDPRTNEIRYVGQTVSTDRRLRNHLNTQKEDMREWILDLKLHGMTPVLAIIEKCIHANVFDRERYWIWKYDRDGNRLFNRTGIGREPTDGDGIALDGRTDAAEFLTPPEAAKLLRVESEKIRNWIKSGELRASDISMAVGGRPRYRIARTDLDVFLARRAVGSKTAIVAPARRRNKDYFEWIK